MVGGREDRRDAHRLAELPPGYAVKLGPVITCDGSRSSKAAENFLQQELNGCGPGCSRQRASFNPTRSFVDDSEDPFISVCCRRQWTDEVHGQMFEWARGESGDHYSRWQLMACLGCLAHLAIFQHSFDIFGKSLPGDA